MSARLEGPSLLRFSVYELDLLTDELRKQGRALRVPPKPLRLLRLLATRAADLVTRDEIKAFLWPATNIDVDRNINLLINKIREILGDDAENPHYIETLPQKGYRFIYPVAIESRVNTSSSLTGLHPRTEKVTAPRSGDAGESHAQGAPIETRLEQERNADAETSRRVHSKRIGRWRENTYSRADLGRASLLAALVAGLAIAAALHLSDQRQHASRVTPPVRLAVLPVENLTGDPGREYIADGMTEEIIAQLGLLNPSQLEVIARTSIMAYKHTNKTVAQIGRELQVDDVLECSLREWEERARINCQLITVHNQAHVWVKAYQSSQRDILKLQSEIAAAVAEEAGLNFRREPMTPAAAAHPFDQRVHDLVLRGRYEWRERKDARLRKAIDYFEQAIALDPNYAQAYADLAGAYVVLPYYSDSSPIDAFREAKAAANKALQLDETLWEPHTVLGLVECSYSNFEVGEREYQRALQLNPTYPTAHHWRSFCLWMLNRRKEALSEMETARRLDPLSWVIYADEALMLAADHQTDRAIQLLKTALDSEPEFAETHRALSTVYVQKGEMSLAIKEARRAVALDPNNSALATLGYAYASAGKTAEARDILAELTNPSRRPPVQLVYLSYVYIGLGQKSEALACLEKAYRENAPYNIVQGADVILDAVRSDPRFLTLVHLAPGSVVTGAQ